MFQVNALAGSVPSSVSVAPPAKEITSPATKNAPSIGEVMVATGRLPTLIVIGDDVLDVTPSETVSLAEYVPA